MGLIKAALGAGGGVLADQWKEFFYCESIDKDILMVKGQKRIGGRSSNTKGSDNIITNGSGIAVADGQCMIIVEQGEIVEVCAEPGEFTFDSSTEPSIFSGSLGDSIKKSFATFGRRFTFGGDTGKDQRVYYFNTKEIIDNKFGTPSPVPFRVVDRNINLDIDVSLRCNGVYSYKLTDPILFYKNIAGNVSDSYERSEIDNQLKSEFVSALQPAFSKLSALEIRPNAIPGHVTELCDAMNVELTDKWSNQRGISIVSIAMNSVNLPDEDAELIKQAQRAGMLRDPSMGAGTLVASQADAMRTAASNENGAMMGFMGMGMAMNAGGMNASNLYQMGQQQGGMPPQGGMYQGQPMQGQPMQGQPMQGQPMQGQPMQGQPAAPQAGAVAGAAVGTGLWKCSCGAENTGKFCQECGSPKPAGAPLYKCDKCGWQPEDPTHPPKFCPECGDLFDDNDIVG